MRSRRSEMRIQAQGNHECNFAFTLKWATKSLGLCSLNRHKAWGCVFATNQKWWLCICNKQRAVRVVYLQQKGRLGWFICSKHKAWGCVVATIQGLGLCICNEHIPCGCVFATTQSLGLCMCNNTKLRAVYLQQPAMPELYVHAELALVLHWLT